MRALAKVFLQQDVRVGNYRVIASKTLKGHYKDSDPAVAPVALVGEQGLLQRDLLSNAPLADFPARILLRLVNALDLGFIALSMVHFLDDGLGLIVHSLRD